MSKFKNFIENCSEMELDQIRDEYEELINNPISFDHSKFIHNLNVLKKSWTSITNKDVEIITNIANKYL